MAKTGASTRNASFLERSLDRIGLSVFADLIRTLRLAERNEANFSKVLADVSTAKDANLSINLTELETPSGFTEQQSHLLRQTALRTDGVELGKTNASPEAWINAITTFSNNAQNANEVMNALETDQRFQTEPNATSKMVQASKGGFIDHIVSEPQMPQSFIVNLKSDSQQKSQIGIVKSKEGYWLLAQNQPYFFENKDGVSDRLNAFYKALLAQLQVKEVSLSQVSIQGTLAQQALKDRKSLGNQDAADSRRASALVQRNRTQTTNDLASTPKTEPAPRKDTHGPKGPKSHS